MYVTLLLWNECSNFNTIFFLYERLCLLDDLRAICLVEIGAAVSRIINYKTFSETQAFM